MVIGNQSKIVNSLNALNMDKKENRSNGKYYLSIIYNFTCPTGRETQLIKAPLLNETQ